MALEEKKPQLRSADSASLCEFQACHGTKKQVSIRGKFLLKRFRRYEEGKFVRRLYDEKSAAWSHSVVEMAGVLTGGEDLANFWRKSKQRGKEKGNRIVTICHGVNLTVSE